MTDPDDFAPSRPHINLRPLLVLAVFLILGPWLGLLILLGVLILMAGLMTAHLGLPPPVPEPPIDFTTVITRVIDAVYMRAPSTYWFGGWQAACVALVAMIANMFRPSGLVPFGPVAIATALTGACFVLFTGSRSLSPPSGGLVFLILVSVGLHVGAGAGCWLIANLILWPFRRRPMPAVDKT